MKILLTMVLTMGMAVTTAIAQDPPKRVCNADEAAKGRRGKLVDLTEQSQQNVPKQRRNWLGEMEISTAQWGLIKAERQKFGVVMKAARESMMGQINVILTPEQQEALRGKREEWRLKAEQWREHRGERGKNDRGHRHGHRRHKLPEEWKTWDDDEKREWRQEQKSNWIAKREQRKAQHETSKPETKTESTEKD